MTLQAPANDMPIFPRPRILVDSKADRVRRALESHYEPIWRFLRRLGVAPADCEDAAQKVFIVFSERIAGIESKAERSFLFASALRVASDARRKKSYSHEQLAFGQEPIDTHDPAPSADEQIDMRRQRAWLDDVLDSLSEEHRAVLVLVDIEEQTMADASDALGIPPGTVASRLRRARELFESGANALKAKLDSAEKESDVMSPSEFSKSLLKSSKIDAPLPNAKTRALARLEHAMNGATTAANAVTTSANAVTSAKLVYSVAAAAAIAGVVGLGGGYTLAQLSPRSRTASVESHASVSAPPAIMNGVAQPISKSDVAIAPSSKIVSPVASAEPVAAADSCKAAVAESSGKCSTPGGHTVTFAVKSDCSQTQLDVFWVDESCREIYRGMLAPTNLFWQDSYEGHVFHLRDHTTHELVKEITASPIGGAPDRNKIWKGPPTEQPVIAIGDADKPITEAPPAECAHGGGRAAVWHFQNDRKSEPIAVTWVDSECREGITRIVEPGKKLEERLSDGHAFRIRDASGALLMDVPPTSLDTSTYLTVP